MAANTKRKLPRVSIDLKKQLDHFVDAPADDGDESDLEENLSFDKLGNISEDSSSGEEADEMSEIPWDDDIGDIITLKDDSDVDSSDDDGGEGDDGSEEQDGSSDEEGGDIGGKDVGSGGENEVDPIINDSEAKPDEKSAFPTPSTVEEKKKLRRLMKRKKKVVEENDKKNNLDNDEKINEKEYGDEAVTGKHNKKVVDEYEFDSSDEEDIRNTVGNIPMEWYQGFDHIGYNVRGEKIIKPPTRDELDEFLSKVDNPNYWRTVFDKKNGEDIVLTDEDLDVIERIQRGGYPEASVDPYPEYIDFFTNEKMLHPLTRRPEHKRSFIPSLYEKAKVSRYYSMMRQGKMKPSWETVEEKKDDIFQFFDIWSQDDKTPTTRRRLAHTAAPKVRLPGHAESYRPPPEYLLSEEEIKVAKAKSEYSGRSRFIPEIYDSLRKVPLRNDYLRDRFNRCLDLYLCPRKRILRNRQTIDDILPKLPRPKDLQPFPTTLALLFVGHTSYVRSISVDPSGQWLASGSDDKTVRFWEVSTGRCLKTIEVEGTVQCISWCPNTVLCLVAFTIDHHIHIFNPKLGDKLIISGTDKLLEDYKRPAELKTSPLVEWEVAEGKPYDQGFRLSLKHFKPVRQITWHGKGDYFACVVPTGQRSSVIIHQLSKRRSQNPFRKSKGLVQCTAFHPTRPFFFVATQRHVRVYNLIKQEMTKKLLTSAKWVSSIAIHPGGDNLVIGTYDCKLSWFDLDLAVTPYKTLRHHKQAIRSVCYHKRYPLFASSSDDGHVTVCHGQVYNDLLQNPLIVPVKVLKGHSITNGLGVLCCEFHPSQPWIFSSAADGIIRLFS